MWKIVELPNKDEDKSKENNDNRERQDNKDN